MALDGQRLGAIGGETGWRARYAGATDRYEIFITGGANNVAVGTR